MNLAHERIDHVRFAENTYYSDLPLPYKFGPPKDTDRDRVKTQLRIRGNLSKAMCRTYKIDFEAVRKIIHQLRNEGWIIDYENKYTAGSRSGQIYRLKYDAELNKRWE